MCAGGNRNVTRMKRSAAQSFEQAVIGLTDATILLDVDGTLLPDGVDNITTSVSVAAQELALKNEVYLVSNGTDRARVERIATQLSIPVAPAGVPAGKPRATAAAGIESTNKRLIVMGDKYLTDGLFARVIGADFVRIERKESGNESFSIRVINWVDGIVSWVL